MEKFRISYFILLFSVVLLSACSKELRVAKKAVQKGTIAEKDSAAFFFFEKGIYEQAAFLFEELIPIYKGTPRAQLMLYKYAYAKYHAGFYLMSAYYFEQYVTQYPNSELAQECSFMSAFCYLQQSDPYYLDQQSTKKAINQFQIFINAYPLSDKVEEANNHMKTLREKLALKSFEQAKLYYKIGNYKAARKSFEVMVDSYPDSKFREESEFMQIKSAVSLANVSTEAKQKGRYLDAIDLYLAFAKKYETSQYLKEAESLYNKARRNVDRITAQEENKS